MFQIKAKVVYNKRVKDGYFLCVFEAGRIASCSLPGQFVNVKVSDTEEPLLRRPFSIHRKTERRIEILYQVVGKGTEIFSERKAGERLDIIGPLGNGFNYEPVAQSRRSAILVAGGMGVAPLVFLAEKLSGLHTPGPGLTTVLIGAKTKKQILCEKEFKQAGCSVKIATDDGSRGFKGYVSDLLEKDLRPKTYDLRPIIYACGPRPMLKEISRISGKYIIPTQISLEEHMACGIGACLGCAVNTRQGYKRVCQEGPVFEAAQIIWE